MKKLLPGLLVIAVCPPVFAEQLSWVGDAQSGNQTYSAKLNLISSGDAGMAILILKDKSGVERQYTLNLKAQSPSNSFENFPVNAPERSTDHLVERAPSGSSMSDGEKKRLAKPYMDSVQKKIKRVWHPIATRDSRLVTVRFFINREGNPEDIKLDDQYGKQIFDDQALAAIHAVESAAPFAPPPDFTLDKGRAEISFTFTRNVAPSAVSFGRALLFGY